MRGGWTLPRRRTLFCGFIALVCMGVAAFVRTSIALNTMRDPSTDPLLGGPLSSDVMRGPSSGPLLEQPSTSRSDALEKCCWNRRVQKCSMDSDCDPGGEGCTVSGTVTQRYGRNVCDLPKCCSNRRAQKCNVDSDCDDGEGCTLSGTTTKHGSHVCGKPKCCWNRLTQRCSVDCHCEGGGEVHNAHKCVHMQCM